VFLIALTFLVIGSVLSTVVGISLNAFVQALPDYQSRLDTGTAAFFDWLKSKHVRVSEHWLLDYLAPDRVVPFAESVVSGLSVLLGNGLVILFTVGFILIEASSFPMKLHAAISNPERALDSFRKFSKAAQRYLLIKTFTSAVTGSGICVCLVIIGVDYPVLWGLLAFLLNFVPYIGGTLATMPPVLLALVQLGVGPAIGTTVACVFVNTVVAILEFRLMAGGVGLSAFVVFLSLVFWGWVLGPIGAVLSVPLTIIIKIALESHDDSIWVATMLGSVRSGGPPDHPAPAPDVVAERET
jgi:predicted PurR-regulated permease PerM